MNLEEKFYSILFPTKEQSSLPRASSEPDCFSDLNLDQVIDPIIQTNKEYELSGFFWTPIDDIGCIQYRQDVLRDFENEKLHDKTGIFSDRLHLLRKSMDALRARLLADRCDWIACGRMLENALIYCNAIRNYISFIAGVSELSSGMKNFASYLDAYVKSDAFMALDKTASDLQKRFSCLQYCMLIKGGTVKVRKYEGQKDLSLRIIDTFSKFRQGDVQDYRHVLSEEPHAIHVEAQVLGMLAGIFKQEFAALESFCQNFASFEDSIVIRFTNEVRFYLSWTRVAQNISQCGLSMCYPEVSCEKTGLHGTGFFDMALASMIGNKTVTNDFYLEKDERILVVTGPNQGGKTTFARALGQIHYLASLGLSVPGSSARLYLCDSVLTHFEKQESILTLNGKLQDELERLHSMLEKTTEKSFVVINEIFASTTLADAIGLGKKMIDRLSQIGCLCVIVTFIDELACHGDQTVSMMSLVSDGMRTYKVARKPPDGLAYAESLAQKHGLSYDSLSRRLIQ